jgi:hypothetical protein
LGNVPGNIIVQQTKDETFTTTRYDDNGGANPLCIIIFKCVPTLSPPTYTCGDLEKAKNAVFASLRFQSLAVI